MQVPSGESSRLKTGLLKNDKNGAHVRDLCALEQKAAKSSLGCSATGGNEGPPLDHTCPQMGQFPTRVIDSGYLNGYFGHNYELL